jgi:hypothetical protein
MIKSNSIDCAEEACGKTVSKAHFTVPGATTEVADGNKVSL